MREESLKKNILVNLLVDADMYEAIRQYKYAHNISRAEVIRQAVNEFFTKKKGGRSKARS